MKSVYDLSEIVQSTTLYMYNECDIDLTQKEMAGADVVALYVAALLVLLLRPRVSIAADEHLPPRDLYVDVAVSPPAPQTLLVRTRLSISVVVTPTGDTVVFCC